MSIGLEHVIEQQQIANRLLAMLLTKLWSIPQYDLIEELRKAGAEDEVIARTLGTTLGTIATTTTRSKKKKRVAAALNTAEAGSGDNNDGEP